LRLAVDFLVSLLKVGLPFMSAQWASTLETQVICLQNEVKAFRNSARVRKFLQNASGRMYKYEYLVK
jgi:hypothetical protein